MNHPTLAGTLAARPNDHHKLRDAFEARTGHPWHAPTPAALAAGRAVSVVIPARNTAYCLTEVLDALAAQDTNGSVEVLVIDDASIDTTADVARQHPVVDALVRLPAPAGAATARNIGTLLAGADTVLYLDADMVLPPHALADVAARASSETVLLGFRHNVPYETGRAGRIRVPRFPASLDADHRVTWHSNGGEQLYTGTVLDGPTTGSPLKDTHDFAELGHAARYLDWDLPRTVVTAVLGVPRHAVEDVGGFDPAFGQIGWGMEDTHLGAALIAAGCLVVPLRQTVGYHLDPPDAASQWKTKLASWPATLAHYRALLRAPAPTGRTARFRAAAERMLATAEVIPR
ncbi:glycosyltransferase [Streptomyces sp. NPDC048172]|uniref:glycosyltransferase n=1 Tax=Streptomyces sp. NPDC048172 TaxID=3365505 RepID=UPI003721DA8D